MRYIYCHPLFDERKCGHRFSYQLSKFFKTNNLNLERFDYRGTGEAEGRFCDITLDSLRKDMREMIKDDRVCIIATRFGATIAFDFCCRSRANIDSLILIEPVVNGQNYVEYLFRKQRLKDMLTGNGSDFSHENGFINLEGYKTSNIFIGQIKDIDLFKIENRIKAKSVFIIQISATSRILPHYGMLADQLQKNKVKADVNYFNIPAFWERIPDGEYTTVNQAILEWSR